MVLARLWLDGDQCILRLPVRCSTANSFRSPEGSRSGGADGPTVFLAGRRDQGTIGARRALVGHRVGLVGRRTALALGAVGLDVPSCPPSSREGVEAGLHTGQAARS